MQGGKEACFIFISLCLSLRFDKSKHLKFVIHSSKFADLFGSDVRFSKKDKTVKKIRIHCK